MQSFEKTRNRKSRAPWQSSNTKNVRKANPYANLATTTPVTTTTPDTNNLLQLPPQFDELTRTISGETIGKHSRRMSIHVSATAHGRRGSFNDSSAPPLPQLNKQISNIGGGGAALTIEERIFKELSNGSAQDVDDYYKSLVKQKQLIDKDIKDNINLNQRNILELTKNLAEIQDELIGLRGSTKELHTVLEYFKESAERRLELEQQTSAPQSQQTLSIPKRKDRSSIMVLEKMWASELQSLFKHVEGASKFIQPIPGRHVLAESGRWQEVNVGTWKPNSLTHIFVLNDLLLIANKKPPSSSNKTHVDMKKSKSSGRLQAINCWPLTQVSLGEINPPANIQIDQAASKVYFINVKSKSLSFVYQTDRYDHFLKIVDSFNKGRNEMVQKERLNKSAPSSSAFQPLIPGDAREEKRHLRESLRNSGNYEGILDEKRISNPNTRGSRDFVLHDISARVHSRNRSHDFSKIINSSSFFNEIKTLEDRLDDVDVELSHNQYAAAVGLISHIESKLASIQSSLTEQQNKTKEIQDEFFLIEISKLKIKNRKENVQNSLQFNLINNISKLTPEEIESILVYYDSFGQLDQGIKTYLEAVSLYLSSTASRLIVGLQGSTKIDVVNYLSNLVVINVAIVTRTIKVYNDKINPILKQHGGDIDSSGLINWCVEEITKLSKQINKNLYGTLLTSSGINIETNQTIYHIKDEKLYNEFTKLMIPQLDELKRVGINVDYIFEPILSLN
ncbi:Exocyst complex component EXO84 [Spathaspora sp. JA1]|nr:Exocyst complex component EXO84 [Spathaspora sp. JA1]